MLIRKLIYQWTCNKCKNEITKEFHIYSHEEFPILRDPLEGWAKYIDPNTKFEEHWCPNCVNKLISLNMEPGKIVWDDAL